MGKEVKGVFVIEQKERGLSRRLRSVVEHSRSRQKHSTSSRYFAYTPVVLYCFLCVLQENRAQSRFL